MPTLRSQRGESRDPCRAFNNPSQAAPIYHIARSIQGLGCTAEARRKIALSFASRQNIFPSPARKFPSMAHGNFRGNGPPTRHCISLRVTKKAKICEFALLIPVNCAETGSHLTARTATLRPEYSRTLEDGPHVASQRFCGVGVRTMLAVRKKPCVKAGLFLHWRR
jgi:hypothetical protein